MSDEPEQQPTTNSSTSTIPEPTLEVIQPPEEKDLGATTITNNNNNTDTTDNVVIPDNANTKNKELQSHISERLCFFFSNANLRQDKFLQKVLLDKVKNPKGFVPIQTLLTFNTLKKWTTDTQKIIHTIKEDDECQSLLYLNDSETAIGRIQPFTVDMITSTEYESRTLRIGNLPLWTPETTTTTGTVVGGNHDTTTTTTTTTPTPTPMKQYAVSIEEIKQLFSQYGKVAMVQLIYNNNHHHSHHQNAQGGGGRNPIGKAFVEFDSIEGYNAAVQDLILVPSSSSSSSSSSSNNTEDVKEKTEEEKKTKTLILGGNELTVKTMEQHLEKQAMKRAAYANGTTASSWKRSRDNNTNDDDHPDEKKLKVEDENKEKAKDEYTWEKGSVIHLQGISETVTTRESILQSLTLYWKEIVQVRIDYTKGNKEGYLRFETPNHEKINSFVQALNEQSLVIDGTSIHATLLQGEEEEKYHEKLNDFVQKRKQLKMDEKQNKQQYRRKNHHSSKSNHRGRR